MAAGDVHYFDNALVRSDAPEASNGASGGAGSQNASDVGIDRKTSRPDFGKSVKDVERDVKRGNAGKMREQLVSNGNTKQPSHGTPTGAKVKANQAGLGSPRPVASKADNSAMDNLFSGVGPRVSLLDDECDKVHLVAHDPVTGIGGKSAALRLASVPITFSGLEADAPKVQGFQVTVTGGEVHPHANLAFYRKVATRRILALCDTPLMLNTTEQSRFFDIGLHTANCETSANANRRAGFARPMVTPEVLLHSVRRMKTSDVVMEDDFSHPVAKELVLGFLARGVRVHMVGINPWLNFDQARPFKGTSEYSSLVAPGFEAGVRCAVHQLRVAETGSTRLVQEHVPVYYRDGVWHTFVERAPSEDGELCHVAFGIRTKISDIGGGVSATSLTPCVLPANMMLPMWKRVNSRVRFSATHFVSPAVTEPWPVNEIECFSPQAKIWFACNTLYGGFVEAASRFSLPNAAGMRRMLNAELRALALVNEDTPPMQSAYQEYLYHKQTELFTSMVESDADARCKGRLATLLARVTEARASANCRKPLSLASLTLHTVYEEVVLLAFMVALSLAPLSVPVSILCVALLAAVQMKLEYKPTPWVIGYSLVRSLLSVYFFTSKPFSYSWKVERSYEIEHLEHPALAFCQQYLPASMCVFSNDDVENVFVRVVDVQSWWPEFDVSFETAGPACAVVLLTLVAHIVWNLGAVLCDRPEQTLCLRKAKAVRKSKLQCVNDSLVYQPRPTRAGWCAPHVESRNCSINTKAPGVIVCAGIAPSAVSPIYWGACVCNQIAAYSRLVGEIRYPDPGSSSLFSMFWTLALDAVTEADFCTLDQYLSLRPRMRAAQLANEALMALQTYGTALPERYWVVNLFVKFEANFVGGVPRPIAPFSPVVQLALGPASHSLMNGVSRLLDGSIENADRLMAVFGLERRVRVLYTAHLSGGALSKWLDENRHCGDNILLVNGDDCFILVAGSELAVECDGSQFEASVRHSALFAEGQALQFLVHNVFGGRLLSTEHNFCAEIIPRAIARTLTHQRLDVSFRGEDGFYARIPHEPTRFSGAGTTSCGNTGANTLASIFIASRVDPDTSDGDLDNVVEAAGRLSGIVYTYALHTVAWRGSFASGVFLPVTRLGAPSNVLCPMLSACSKMYWPKVPTQSSEFGQDGKLTAKALKRQRMWIYQVAVGLRDFLPIPVLGAYVFWGLMCGKGVGDGPYARVWHKTGTYEVTQDTYLALADRYGISVVDLLEHDKSIRDLAYAMRNDAEIVVEDDWPFWDVIHRVDGRVLKSGRGTPTQMEVE